MSRVPLKLRVKLEDPMEDINIGRVAEASLAISSHVTIRIFREDRETFVMADTEVINPEGPWPTKTVTECLYSFLHAEGR